MIYTITKLTSQHLDEFNVAEEGCRVAYMSKGSLGYCLMANGVPVVIGGVVNADWRRGEAWMRSTPFMLCHIKSVFRYLRDMIPLMAVEGNFRRIQVVCLIDDSVDRCVRLFEHLGFEREGTMRGLGPNGEDCHMYARLF